MTEYSKIPKRTIEALDRYVHSRIVPGHFLIAVLTNNLFEAMDRADKENRDALYEIIRYVWNELPLACWGSKEKMDAWIHPEEEQCVQTIAL